jgi:hypothetical protein
MKRIVFLLGIGVAIVAVLYAGWRLRQWREAEEEKRLRQIQTLTGIVHRDQTVLAKRSLAVHDCLFPAPGAAPNEIDG